ncbi:MAG: hypothetical protein Ta2E_00670 [Mycoplasmoidaceae bacterium]|nr:MAG: hypothetical protein Ta2E_00670 [Mycoplasmoidaceae bacterium]
MMEVNMYCAKINFIIFKTETVFIEIIIGLQVIVIVGIYYRIGKFFDEEEIKSKSENIR